MRVLLIGANGYLGRFVAERLLADPAVQLTALGRGDDADVRFDLATGSPGALTRFLGAVHPGVVINCAGATRGGARELMIPAVDQFIAEVNVDEGYLRVNMMEGL